MNQQNNFLLHKTRNVLIAEWDDTAGLASGSQVRPGLCVDIGMKCEAAELHNLYGHRYDTPGTNNLKQSNILLSSHHTIFIFQTLFLSFYPPDWRQHLPNLPAIK